MQQYTCTELREMGVTPHSTKRTWDNADFDEEIEEASGIYLCPGCGGEFSKDDPRRVGVDTEVNCRDGKKRRLLFCDRTCPEFWDDTAPGEWVSLDCSEEVQLVYWRCHECDGVYECDSVKLALDTDYEPPEETIVCVMCLRKHADRYKLKGSNA